MFIPQSQSSGQSAIHQDVHTSQSSGWPSRSPSVYISRPFQNGYDGHPSAVAGHAVTCHDSAALVRGLSEERLGGARRGSWRWEWGAAYSVCGGGDTRGGAMRGGCGRGTHRDEREAAARVDRDASRVSEPGAATGAVEVALGSAAGERGGRPGGDVDTADAVVASVLRCIMGKHTE
eukprot:scaffold13055_cov56-Phaeocystis_antarctica.AAC.3